LADRNLASTKTKRGGLQIRATSSRKKAREEKQKEKKTQKNLQGGPTLGENIIVSGGGHKKYDSGQRRSTKKEGRTPKTKITGPLCAQKVKCMDKERRNWVPKTGSLKKKSNIKKKEVPTGRRKAPLE